MALFNLPEGFTPKVEITSRNVPKIAQSLVGTGARGESRI